MTEKESFRKHCLKRLHQINNQGTYKKDKHIISLLYRLIYKSNAKSIMLYIPLEIEVNIMPLIRQLRREKKQLYVPFMEGKSFRLVKYRLPLKKKQFAVREPNNSKQYRKKDIDMAIVPVVGLDSTLRRVGFGKGMYDRFFEKTHKNIKQVVFVTRELCYSKKIVTDDYDLRADKILTSQKRPKDIYNARYNYRCFRSTARNIHILRMV